MNKKRIYEFAKEIEKSSKEVDYTLNEKGEDINNHKSTISEDVQFKRMKKIDEENTEPTETTEHSETIEAQPKEEPEKVDDKNKIVYEKTLTVEELAGKLNKDISEIIKKLMFSGVMATKNEDLSEICRAHV